MPFSIEDPEQLDKLSRYLIEDEDEMVESLESSKQSISIVKSIFSKLLGTYEPKLEAEYLSVNNSILFVSCC